MVRTTCSRLTSSTFHLNFPALIFCRSSRSLIRRVSRSVSSLITRRYFCWRAASIVPARSIITSAKYLIEVSGVRSSCETIEMKSSFISLSLRIVSIIELKLRPMTPSSSRVASSTRELHVPALDLADGPDHARDRPGDEEREQQRQGAGGREHGGERRREARGAHDVAVLRHARLGLAHVQADVEDAEHALGLVVAAVAALLVEQRPDHAELPLARPRRRPSP